MLGIQREFDYYRHQMANNHIKEQILLYPEPTIHDITSRHITSRQMEYAATCSCLPIYQWPYHMYVFVAFLAPDILWYQEKSEPPVRPLSDTTQYKEIVERQILV